MFTKNSTADQLVKVPNPSLAKTSDDLASLNEALERLGAVSDTPILTGKFLEKQLSAYKNHEWKTAFLVTLCLIFVAATSSYLYEIVFGKPHLTKDIFIMFGWALIPFFAALATGIYTSKVFRRGVIFRPDEVFSHIDKIHGTSPEEFSQIVADLCQLLGDAKPNIYQATSCKFINMELKKVWDMPKRNLFLLGDVRLRNKILGNDNKLCDDLYLPRAIIEDALSKIQVDDSHIKNPNKGVHNTKCLYLKTIVAKPEILEVFGAAYNNRRKISETSKSFSSEEALKIFNRGAYGKVLNVILDNGSTAQKYFRCHNFEKLHHRIKNPKFDQPSNLLEAKDLKKAVKDAQGFLMSDEGQLFHKALMKAIGRNATPLTEILDLKWRPFNKWLKSLKDKGLVEFDEKKIMNEEEASEFFRKIPSSN